MHFCQMYPLSRALHFNHLHPNTDENTYSSYRSLHIFCGVDKKYLFKNQELVKFVIFSFILVTLMFDSLETLYGEYRC